MRNAEDARTRRTDTVIGGAATVSATENLPAQRPPKLGTIVHGGWWLWRILRSGVPNRRSAVGRRFEARRLAYAVAKSYPSWSACPAPLQTAIDNALRLEFLVAALFSGFWSGKDVPRAYYTAAENLRRQLRDVGLDAAPAGLDVAAALAAMRESDHTREAPQRVSHAKGQAP